MADSRSRTQASSKRPRKRSARTTKHSTGRLSPEEFAEIVRNRQVSTGLASYGFWYDLLHHAAEHASSDTLPARRGRIWA